MTTTTFALAAIATAFVIGFLLGDRRAVRQCNRILDEHCNTLLKAMMEERPFPVERAEDVLPTQATIH